VAATKIKVIELAKELEGRRRMTAAEFLHGAQPKIGEQLQSEQRP